MSALAEAKVSRSVDVNAFVRIASIMHQRFPEFTKALQKSLVKVFEKQKKLKGDASSAAVSGVTLISSADTAGQSTESESQKQMKQYVFQVQSDCVRKKSLWIGALHKIVSLDASWTGMRCHNV